jgi:hypothetical protein
MNKSGRHIFRRAWVKNKGSKATMSRKDELLKLAQLFHSQDAKRTLHRMGQFYQNEAAHAPDRRAERQRKLRQFNRYPEQAA